MDDRHFGKSQLTCLQSILQHYLRGSHLPRFLGANVIAFHLTYTNHNFITTCSLFGTKDWPVWNQILCQFGTRDWNQRLAGLEPKTCRSGTKDLLVWNQRLAGLEPNTVPVWNQRLAGLEPKTCQFGTRDWNQRLEPKTGTKDSPVWNQRLAGLEPKTSWFGTKDCASTVTTDDGGDPQFEPV